MPRVAAVRALGVRLPDAADDGLVHAIRHGRVLNHTVVVVCRPYHRINAVAAAPPVTCLWCAAEKVRFF